MIIKKIKLCDLKPYENNPRFNENAIDVVAKSIEEFGFKVPIVIDSNNVIVAGHTRYKASEKLGLDKVPCIVADDLSDEQIKAFRLADNKVQEFSSWDNSKLALELENFELEEFGFMKDSYDTQIVTSNISNKEIDLDEYEDDSFDCKCPNCNFVFNTKEDL